MVKITIHYNIYSPRCTVTFQLILPKCFRYVMEVHKAHPGGRAVKGVGLQPLACWDCGFKSRREDMDVCLLSV